ncbi:MAG TPA: hypothetical protein VFD65_03115 [Chitinophagales bacterium]|nr:hypothetical protein [Chitinophagales bacterium]
MDIFKTLKDSFSLSNLKDQVGSAKRTAQMLEKLLSLLQDNKISTSAKEMISNLKVLMTDQPNIASINHYINHFLLKLNPEDQPIVLKEILEVFHERWKYVDRKTAQITYNLYNFKGKRIAFYGNSETMQSLIDICVVNQTYCEVIQVLGKKDKEAQEQAIAIREKGIEVTAVDLYNFGRLKDKVDFLILSSDIIMHETFIVKAGSHLLTTWAKQNEIPILVLSDSRKILNTKILPQSVLGSFIKETPRSPSEIWKSAPENIEIFNYNFETINNKLVDFFVLENQAYRPAELYQEVDKILVSKFI